MTIFFSILIFIVSSVVLVYSGTLAVGRLVEISKFLKWKEFIVSSVLMAFTTSMPELFIGISSAIDNKPEISFGDVIGSNIIALTLVIGIGVFIAGGIKFEGKTMQRSSFYAALIGLAPFVLIIDMSLSRFEGALLIILFILYFRSLFMHEERFSKAFTSSAKRDWKHFKIFIRDLEFFALSIIFLLLSSRGIIYSATNIAEEFGLSLVIIGIFLVALGTSLPEIVFGIKSVTTGHKEMILGNVIGSVVVNSTLVLGVAALICPMEIPNLSPYLIGAVFTVFSVLFFSIFLRTSHTISKKEAFILIIIYMVFVALEISGEMQS